MIYYRKKFISWYVVYTKNEILRMRIYIKWKIELTYVIRTWVLVNIEEERERYEYMNWYKLEWTLKLRYE